MTCYALFFYTRINNNITHFLRKGYLSFVNTVYKLANTQFPLGKNMGTQANTSIRIQMYVGVAKGRVKNKDFLKI